MGHVPKGVTTQRRTGAYGKAVFKDGTTSIWDGADISEWQFTETATFHDAESKNDLFQVKQRGRIGATASAKKLVSTPLLGKIRAGDVLTIELYGGADPDTPTTEQTTAMVSGTWLVASFGYQSPDGMETEDVQFTSSGEYTITPETASP